MAYNNQLIYGISFIAFLLTVVIVISFSFSGKKKKDPFKDDNTFLVIGDSIAEGKSNQKKGYVGDMGYKFYNHALSGATLGFQGSFDKEKWIPNQLKNFYNKNPNIKPKFVIANGGVNDYYFKDLPLGESPRQKIETEREAERLDKKTVLGGLDYLLFHMNNLYPDSLKYFVIPHKMTFRGRRGNFNWEDYVNFDKTLNKNKYNIAKLFNIIRERCKLYGITVIDLHKDSPFDSSLNTYVQTRSFFKNYIFGHKNYIHPDGVHLTEEGYKNGYMPYIKKALSPFLTVSFKDIINEKNRKKLEAERRLLMKQEEEIKEKYKQIKEKYENKEKEVKGLKYL